jgi:mRNA interferase RelE/StbE
MAYTVTIERRAEKFLRQLTDKRLYLRLREAIDGLAENPRPPDYVKLKGNDEVYRVRVGDYRVIYQIQDAVLIVVVVEIGHRREIYRT